MVNNFFDKRIKINDIIENQIPEFLLAESPKFSEFLKQYYISQEYQSGSIDIVENLDQYLKLDNLTSDVLNTTAVLLTDISETETSITVSSIKGFPQKYGLLKIDDEIITYTEISGNTFIGCVRGFSGITNYHSESNQNELVFSTSEAESHIANSEIINLSALFLKEFYKKIKYSLTPGLENSEFVGDLNVGNFIKESKSLYQSKGTSESFKILFNILYGETPTIVDLENLLIKPSTSNYIRRKVIVAELLNPPANPINLIGQTIKSTKNETSQGSVSEVELITRKGKTYYKIFLFIGFDDSNSTESAFNITPKTKVLQNVSVGSSVISVDSTIGFAKTGDLICGSNYITYTDKSINQFFGCRGVNTSILSTSDIRSDEYVYGYENGDLTKKVELRLTGVISRFIQESNINYVDENQIISIKNIGEIIKNPENNKTNKEIFANSWIYNTSTRYQVDTINGSTFTLLSTPDKSSLKVGDNIDILTRGNNNILVSDAVILNINTQNKQIIVSNLGSFVPSNSLRYDIRRKIKTASSTGIPLEFENNTIIADIQNLYTDNNTAYVASNSLPSYNITKNLVRSILPEASGSPQQSQLNQGYLQGYSNITLKYSQISFDNPVPFISGDSILYESDNPIPGLISGFTYYVEVLNPSNKIRLYYSSSFVSGVAYVEFDSLLPGSGSHSFTLSKQKFKIVSPQKILRKFPINRNLEESSDDETLPGPIGLLVNGVEIINSKSDDKIYYGPIDSVTILNSGNNYDIINPPLIEVSSPNTGGENALLQPVVSGSIKKVTVDPQEFDLNAVFSSSVVGGNGSGAILEPIVSRKFNECEFDARPLNIGGGLDVVDETITFFKNHNLKDGESIVYISNGNALLGIQTYFTTYNQYQNSTLINGATYYAKIVNPSTIKLYSTFNDYFVGINTVGITTTNNGGIHKFRTLEKNTLREIKVISEGENYENRTLIVNPSVGISTTFSTITFKNHGFKNGDLINYQTSIGFGSSISQTISGLSTENQYYVLKMDDLSFRLCDAGNINSNPSKDNFERNKYVTFDSTGIGQQIFKYPPVKVLVNVSYGGTVSQIIEATPTVRGKIIDTFVYEKGSKYGSDSVINLQRTPVLKIKNGKNAQLRPIINAGRIVRVDVLSGGSEYYSTPDIIVKGNGVGAILRPIVQNQKITSIIIINSGVNYDETTLVEVVPAGSGALLEAKIRSLTINNNYRFGDEILFESNKNIQYYWSGYSFELGEEYLNDSSSAHSPIIGWAYDGNPIYGPYGFSDPEDFSSPLKILSPGYELDTSKIEDRPSGFSPGFFIEDYSFVNNGDLDKHNGRFCVTPEFPLGTYAYFVGVSTDPTTNKLKSIYPYFIGNTYRSPFIDENILLNQDFDFNNSNLIRNTFPYKVNDEYADNEFLIESNEIVNQLSIVDSISDGPVTSLKVLSPGDGYKVGDTVNFDDSGTGGGGLSAKVSSINGKDITNVSTNIESYNSSIFVWKNSSEVIVSYTPYHTLTNNDTINISGLNTQIPQLLGNHKVGVSTSRVLLFNDVASNVVPRFVNDLYLSHIPQNISIGSSISIDDEILKVLNIFPSDSVIRVKRSDVGSAHSISTPVNILPNTFSIPIEIDYFDSKLNNQIYFNPKYSVGIGTTTGTSIGVNYTIGNSTKEIAIPIQNIYLPNHQFETGQEVTLSKYSTSSAILVSDTSDGLLFNLPESGNSQTVYIINKSKDFIGLTTQVGLTTNTEGLYFRSNGDDDYEYSLTSNFTQVIGNVEKINSVVSISTSHGLLNGDKIKLTINPNLSVGLGSLPAVVVKYNSNIDRLLINPVGFTSSNISTSSNIITIASHGLKTGDKVFYDSYDTIASGLSTGGYFVYKIDDNNLQLAETLYDAVNSPPTVKSIIGVGGSRHEISLINPQILSIRDNDLVFDVSDSSLSGKNLKFYYDKEFNSEFIGVGNSINFNVSGVGTVGVNSEAKVVLKYSNDLPQNIFYTLETSGDILIPDKDVNNWSEILFTNSFYNGTYEVSGVTTTSFNISIPQKPERLSYASTECSVLKYTSQSLTANGGVDKLNIIFSGANYKIPPKFLNISSLNGNGANISIESDNIGKINDIRILNEGFDYSVDKTLKPEAYISPQILIYAYDKIENIIVTDGGKNYSTPPDLVIKNTISNKIVEGGNSLQVNTSSSSISSVDIISPIYGLESVEHELIAINNSNGVGISSVVSSSSGIITCTLSTPILGFTTSVFSVGDEVLVEGIQKEGLTGTGFNSEDYDYSYFKVISYTNTNPAIVEYDLSDYTTNPGIAKTFQSGFASIIKKSNIPQFEVIQNSASFIENEQILIKNQNNFTLVDLYVESLKNSLLKVSGSHQLSIGDIIKGKNSGILATIVDIKDFKAKFDIDSSLTKNYGWKDNVGNLNESYQVIPDNDYYQNLSYTIKSSIEFNELINPVNRILHSAGLKNFADTQIESRSLVSYAKTSFTNDLIILDIKEEKRVDTINNFDFTIDVDTYQNKSKYLKLKNKKLSSYIECVSNRVLLIDDISRRFSNRGALGEKLYADISLIEDSYYKYLVQVIDPNNFETQISEIVVLANDNDVFTFEKALLTNTPNTIGQVSGFIDDSGNKSLIFTPDNAYDNDYDIKVLQSQFNSTTIGINTESIGFINLTGVNTSVGIGTTISIISFNKNQFESLFANIQITNTSNNEMNYVELFLDHDNTNTYISEYYFDTSTTGGITTNFMGSFDSTISGDDVILKFHNTENSPLFIRNKIVGFGSTAVGVGTYRFLLPEQTAGTEKSALYETNYSISSGISTVVGISTDLITTVKSLVRVSYGNTSSLHQILTLQDKYNGQNQDVYTLQYPFLSIGSTSGIGTFGAEINESQSILKFYPDAHISDPIEIQSFSEILYTDSDYENIAPDLVYGPVTESVILGGYDAINGTRVNRLNFRLNYENTPIFAKTFNPRSSSQLNSDTGILTIKNHFFSPEERLIYTPRSTFAGIAATSIGIGLTLNSSGILTDRLPQDVYAIPINEDQFRLSTRKEYAQAGIYVTFTDFGVGNAHQLEMFKKLEKTIISIDGVVQKPLTYTPISYILENNSGQIGAAQTYLSISGISSIKTKDLVKINDEFANILSVGLGTNSNGPITGFGTFPLIEVTRGFVGTSATSHSDGSVVQIYRGSFNIVNSDIYFTEPPKGPGGLLQRTNSSNLPFTYSDFGGRVYLRNDYTNNLIFDDISDQFTGIGQTFTLSVQGINTTLYESGSSILFLNDVFQTPTTENNQGNNYEITQSGISSVRFTGITSSNGDLIISDFDVNQNQLPRGGLIVSLGSTTGLGFAPLVGASVTAIISGGVITAVGVGSTDIIGSGYRGVVSIGVTDALHTGSAATITATVGLGGTLSFNVIGGGTGYVNPTIQIPQPSYENLEVIGVSRRGIGNTTETGKNLLVTLDVGAVSTTGIGSTLFEVSSFTISRPGYGFEIGDVFKPVGLVTDRNLIEPINDFELTVLDTFTDSFYSWQFGELDYIDSIKFRQDGIRRRFPLFYNSRLLSFEKPVDSTIDLNNVLLIFINGVIQEPGIAYQFDGGTSFTFTEAPKPEDLVAIFFYRGTRDDDSVLIEVDETIKIGDSVQIYKNDLYPNTISQNKRQVDNILASDTLETNIYNDQGIDEINYKPFSWEKQKIDKIISNDYVYKDRDSIEPQIYPTSRLILDFNNSDANIFVDNAKFFNYEEDNYGEVINNFDALIIQGNQVVSAALTATVSIGGTIESLTITNPGSGYIGTSINVKISAPKNTRSGIGSIASATASIVNGSISSPIIITNPGLGYTVSAPPQVIVETPPVSYGNIIDIAGVEGFSGIVTGITTSSGIGGHSLAIQFFMNSASFTGLQVGYPIYVFNTSVGTGVTSVDYDDNSVLGIGTEYVDNIYKIHDISVFGSNAVVTSNIASTSNTSNINISGFTTSPVGNFSWGRFYNFDSSSLVSIAVSGFTVNSGLSTFPTIQRRGYGLRDNGSIKKLSNI